jgi:outer membrane lipoprotein-sorting protein
MQRAHLTVFATIVLLVFLAGQGARAGGPPSAAQILEKADKAGFAKSSHMLIEQTIRTTSGDTRTFTIESWSKNGNEKSLMRFLSPAPSQGIGMLALDHGDNIWAYFPDSDDLRKIASSARNSSMEGSDFSYEDMTLGEMGRRYKAVSREKEDLEGKACYKLVLEPKKSSPYSKIVSWVDASTYIAYKSHYLNKKGKHTKTLTMSGWKKIKGVWTPKKMVMKNLKRGSKTVIKILKVKYNLDIKDSKFTTQTLTLV